MFGLAYPWLLLSNVLLLIFWAALRKRYFLLSLGCIIMGWGHLTTLVGLNLSSSEKQEESFRVMSYNTLGFSKVFAKKYKKNYEKVKPAFYKWIRSKANVSILCAQEFGGRLSLLDSLNFPHHHSLPLKTASIHSKFPIVDKGQIQFENSRNSALWADLDIGKHKKIRVYSIHLQSSRINPQEIDVVTEGKIKEKETWLGLKEVISKFKNASIIRANQAEKVMKHIEKSPYPVIVGGDFNETPLSYAYHLFAAKLNDAFKVKGNGRGSTYAGKIPIFGVCLGLQAITEVFGGKIINLDEVFHGVATEMKVVDKDAVIFKDIPVEFDAARYHSWLASDEGFPSDLVVTVRDEDGGIQAIEHKTFPISAVQFHPESILTEVGEQIVRNFIEANS